MPRTLDGLTVGDFDEIIVNDDLTVKGSTTLSGMNLDGSLTATAINASGDVATTGDVSGADITASGTVSGTTITASGNVSGVDISASGDMTCDGLTTTGNSTLGNAISDLQTINGVVNINSQYVFGDNTFNGHQATISTMLTLGGSGELIVSGATNTAIFGADATFGGEVSMSEGGSEVFNYNDHGLTNVGSIAMTTGGDITNCDEITCGTLHLNTALNMDGVSLDLGDGSLTSNGGINTTGSTSCRAIDTNNSNLSLGSGTITTTGLTSCGALQTNNNNINTGTGSITASGGFVGGYGTFLDALMVTGDGQFRCSYIDGDGGGGDVIYTNGNFLSETNRMIPPNVYDNAGQWVMPFTAGDFRVNDDSTYYNYAIDDDGAKTRGRGLIKSTPSRFSSLSICNVSQVISSQLVISPPVVIAMLPTLVNPWSL